MSSPTRLSDNEIQEHLTQLPYWRYANNALERVHTGDTYLQALDLLYELGKFAEEQNHHPDLYLRYKELTIRYWTHTAQGVTLNDVEAARAVEKFIRSRLS